MLQIGLTLKNWRKFWVQQLPVAVLFQMMDGDLTKKQGHFLNKNLDSSEELYNIMGADAHEVARWTLGKACDAVSE